MARKLIWAMLGLIVGGHLVAAAALMLGGGGGSEAKPVPEKAEYEGGWQETPTLRERLRDRQLFWGIPAEWKAGGEGKTRLLYQDYAVVHGQPYEPRRQGDSPSCVGQAVAAAVDFLAAVEIRAGESERGPPRTDASTVYGLSRVEIGNRKLVGGGSHNLWAVQAIQQYGTVPMHDYPLLGIDLSDEDADRCIKYGMEGCPDSLEAIAKLHPVRDYIAIESYEDMRDALYYGCPVVVGSRQGFGAKSGAQRDGDGFLNPPRRLFRPSVWRHSMVVIAVCDEGRQGVLFLNSWGPKWISGPKRFGDEPDGSFWVDREIVERMIAGGDTYAIRGYQGYPAYQLWK